MPWLERVAEAVDLAVRPERNLHFLVFPAQQLAYGRVPKAANSSVKRALHRTLWPRRDVDRVGRKLNKDRFWRNKPEHRVQMCTPQEQLARDDVRLVFCVVRNPFDRLVSCYQDKIVDRARLLPAFAYTGFRKDMTFPEFVMHAVTVCDAVADNHLRSQFDMLSHEGRLVPQVVCRVERLARDWRRLQRRVRRVCRVRLADLDHVNRRRELRDTSRYFADPALVRAVRARYAADFEAFYPLRDDP